MKKIKDKLKLMWIIWILIRLHKLRYKQILDEKTYKVYLKDRLLFWKKPEWKGLVYVGEKEK